MKVVRRNLWFCSDCTMVACNGAQGTDLERMPQRLAEINAGLAALGPHLVPDFNSDSNTGIWTFSTFPCDCCSDWRAGERHRFAILGE